MHFFETRDNRNYVQIWTKNILKIKVNFSKQIRYRTIAELIGDHSNF